MAPVGVQGRSKDHSPRRSHGSLHGRASAFFPGKSKLQEQLHRLGVDTLLIAGAVTNICCESSARDAVELGYKVIMVSDVLCGHAHGLHEATLATFYRIFGDVRPASEVIDLLCGTSLNTGSEPVATPAIATVAADGER